MSTSRRNKNILQKKSPASSVVRREQFIHQGPIPDPYTLQKYNEVIPNAAERILIMAENQNLHRMNQEKLIASQKVKLNSRGQWFGFIIALVVIIAGTTLIFLGHDAAGTVICSIDLVAIVSIFVLGRNKK